MSKVYVIQHPASKVEGRWQLWDIRDAERFGRVCVMLELLGNVPDDNAVVQDVVGKLQAVLSCFTRDDYLLLAGDPYLIAVASHLATQRTGGFLRVLKWDKHHHRYHPMGFNLPL